MKQWTKAISAVLAALLHPFHSSFSVSQFTIHLFPLLSHWRSSICLSFRSSDSTVTIFVERQCESHFAFPRITFTYIFIAHTYPSYPFSSVFFINVSLLSVYIYHSSTFFFFRWPTFVFLISSRTFSQSIYFFLAIDFNQQSARVFVLLSFNVYVSPRSLYVARGKVLN